MVPASSTTASQMFPERTVINTSGKFITAIILHSFLFYSSPSSWNFTDLLSSKSKVTRGHQAVIHPRRKDLCGKPTPLHPTPKANLEDQEVQLNITFWPLHRNLWTRSQADPVSTRIGSQGENRSCFSYPCTSQGDSLLFVPQSLPLSSLCLFTLFPNVSLRTQGLREVNRWVINTCLITKPLLCAVNCISTTDLMKLISKGSCKIKKYSQLSNSGKH